MRKVSLARNALKQIKRLSGAQRRRAAEAIAQLRSGGQIPVHLLPATTSFSLYALPSDGLVIVFGPLRDELVVVSVVERRGRRRRPIALAAAHRP